jgi:hypothetical protein
MYIAMILSMVFIVFFIEWLKSMLRLMFSERRLWRDLSSAVQHRAGSKDRSTCYQLHAGFLNCLFFDLDDRIDKFIRNIDWLSPDCTALYPRIILLKSNSQSYYFKSTANCDGSQSPPRAVELRKITLNPGASGSVVGWGTMLQIGRSRVRMPMRSLDISIDLILPAALCP